MDFPRFDKSLKPRNEFYRKDYFYDQKPEWHYWKPQDNWRSWSKKRNPSNDIYFNSVDSAGPTNSNEFDSFEIESNEVNFNDINSNEIPDENSEPEKIVFSYNESDEFGPTNWGRISAFCDGNSQSPINLVIEKSIHLNQSDNRNALMIDGFNINPSAIRVDNTGHSVALRFNFSDGKPARLIGGPLKTAYIIDNIHWHWGSKDSAGSEHQLNYKRFSAEAHIVAYNSDYGKEFQFLKR